MKPETTYPAVLGTVLSQKRKEKGWDQATAAQKCEINRSSWSRMENGEIVPDVVQINKICEVFQISVNDFFAEVKKAEELLKEHGVEVHPEKKKTKSNKIGWFLAGAALGALTTAALSGKKKDAAAEEEPDDEE